ncbi:putative Mediator of RNA polymerase II transcription subunit 21 [Glarea lozoyensis 74030]|uniref:Mediator of RNA polymerase II transcription subunit 21 n=1 Tax=Glarea lozoyensis (strain ATCC 74030 / MF5533) TaxID=1104152 RepID=H0EET5_GLAL7|nr:putative Mediator of RNA polymerase II transcription subunit 21 [Glarea lozoyensis 74030]
MSCGGIDTTGVVGTLRVGALAAGFEVPKDVCGSDRGVPLNLATQFLASVHFVNKHHELKTLSPKDSIRDTKKDDDGAPQEVDPLPADQFKAGQTELAQDLIVKEQQIDENDQEKRMKELEEELKVAEEERQQALKEKEEVLTKLEGIIRSIKRP